MHRKNLVFYASIASLSLGLTNPSHADLVTGFNGTDNGGWSLDNPGILTAVSNAAGTGVAGIEFNDQSNGPNRYVSPWSGDLSGQIGQSLRYGLVFVRPSAGANWAPFSMDILISDGTITLAADLDYDIAEPPLSTLLNQNVTLNAATFGTDAATFAAVMGDVTYLKIRAEHWDANGVEGYLTNVIPEPAVGVWLAAVATATSLRRRSRR